MCNRYVPPEERDIEREWNIGARNQPALFDKVLFPRGKGAFIRRGRDDAGYSRELVTGQWGLIPWFAKSAKLPYATNNARGEELASKASYKHPWSHAQRCIIPAFTFREPNWESGKNVWWDFARANGHLWGLAGIWNASVDKASGEQFESYSMITLNANAHPLMSRMHKPEVDPETKRPLPLDQQDKRSVIPIEAGDVDAWLAGTMEEAQALLRLAPVEVFAAGPVAA